MKTNTVESILVLVAVASALCGCGRRPNVESIVIPGENGQKWTFLAVEGTSHLPMDFIRAGENRDALEPVEMAKFWVAADMVTEGDFAAIMGRDVPESRSPGQPVANIEWIDAYEYCRRFTDRYRIQIPQGFIASIPAAQEWAHAVSVLDGKVDLRSDVGTFLFTGSAYGGFLATKPCRLGKKNVNAGLAVNMDVVGRHMKSHHAGLRLVLMPIEVRSNGPSPIVYRSGVLSEQGFFKEMKELLKFALERKVLTPDDEDRAKLRLGCAEDSHDFEGYEHEDWAGIVAKSAVFVEAKGYAVEPYATEWQMLEFQRPAENKAVADAYRKAGVVGEWVRICDLPNLIREAQPVGEDDFIRIFNDNGKPPFDCRYKISESNLVQVLKCDFTGDGMEDWVVEQCSIAESDDYHYSFWKQIADGGYEKIDCLQFIGLCALPRMDGKGCGFLIVEREDLVITVDLLEFNGTGFDRTPISAKPFNEIEPYEVRYQIGAPFIGSQFIGAGYGFGRCQLESKGVWFSPLFWPWKQGFVQSYEEAIRQAKAKR